MLLSLTKNGVIGLIPFSFNTSKDNNFNIIVICSTQFLSCTKVEIKGPFPLKICQQVVCAVWIMIDLSATDDFVHYKIYFHFLTVKGP